MWFLPVPLSTLAEIKNPSNMGCTVSPFCYSQWKSTWYKQSHFPAHSFTPCLVALLQLGSLALPSPAGAVVTASPLWQHQWLSVGGCLLMHWPGPGPSSLTSSCVFCHRPGTLFSMNTLPNSRKIKWGYLTKFCLWLFEPITSCISICKAVKVNSCTQLPG